MSCFLGLLGAEPLMLDKMRWWLILVALRRLFGVTSDYAIHHPARLVFEKAHVGEGFSRYVRKKTPVL